MSSLFEAPAIKLEQPIGEFWVAAIPAGILLNVTVPDRLRLVFDTTTKRSHDFDVAVRMLGNQRKLEQLRLNEIERYIDTVDSTFPNSIILSANSHIDEPSTRKGGQDWRISGGRIVIPNNPRLLP